MQVFFCFSDEAGSYRQSRSERFKRAHPYFIRSAVLLSVNDWVRVHDNYRGLLSESGLPFGKELKWSYIGSIIQHRKRGEEIPKDKPYAVFSRFSEEQLWNHVCACLQLLHDTDYCRLIYTVTDNVCPDTGSLSEWTIYQMHIQDLMQRIELELRPRRGLAIVFLDPLSDERANRFIRNAYASFYQGDEYIAGYRCIKDSLAYELSHHSSGIRFADYAAGMFNAFLRGFSPSTELFSELIWPLIRKNPSDGDPLGYGIIDVPKRVSVRANLKRILREVGLLDK